VNPIENSQIGLQKLSGNRRNVQFYTLTVPFFFQLAPSHCPKELNQIALGHAGLPLINPLIHLHYLFMFIAGQSGMVQPVNPRFPRHEKETNPPYLFVAGKVVVLGQQTHHKSKL
jgi:hypothetical protein